MRVFLTGATGYIGSSVAHALRNAGHEVTALVRPDADTRRLRDLGVFLVSGDLSSLPALGETFASHDAFVHSASAAQEREALDALAVDTFTALNRPFVYTSGVWVLGNNDGADEASPVNPLEIVAWRPAHEERVLGSGGAVIRPGVVYGGRQSIAAGWFGAAEQNQPVQIVGDGTNRWTWVDVHELGDLYARTVAESARGMFHGIDDTDVTVEECIRAVGDVQIEKVPIDAARAQMGGFADALAVNQRIASTHTRNTLGWMPKKTFTNSVGEQWAEWRKLQQN